ncbi:MAG: hypothetical protein PHQ58_04845 [Rhodoferax sp.]|uniref:hypothetical protein n=1 Tax=Rhodoferax sp. TaxID=50421 RepID=UPI00260EF753|nr:hypothetical protein [Rhodoferax sp.]MDD2879741.1 hypothetical protein [Rhodoferax sp.]
MVKQQDYQALIQGLHRKLLNINHDIRSARKQKAAVEIMAELIQRRKAVDKAYSKCVTCLGDLQEQDIVYKESFQIYNTH